MSTPLLPWFYDHVEPAALRIAERAAKLEPVDAQRAYLVEASKQIVASGSYARELPRGASGEELSATLTWFQILDEELDGYVGGARAPDDLIARGGGHLWAAFQAHEPICASWARGVARTLAPRVAGRRVLELGAGTGGTTRLLAGALRRCHEFVVSDVRESFLDRIVAGLPGVPVSTAVLDVDAPAPALGNFDVIYATNCLHVSKDVDASLARLKDLLRPGGMLVLGEGSHYSPVTPSPLSLVLALFDGWWDAPRPRPGFLQPGEWLAALRGAGYAQCSAQTWGDDRREFGGVFTAYA